MPALPESEAPETDTADNRRIPLTRPGRGASRRRRAEILRVDHAGHLDDDAHTVWIGAEVLYGAHPAHGF